MIISALVILAFFGIVFSFLIFVALDVWAAFDDDPKSITLSTKVKHFVRKGKLNLLAVLALLWVGGFGLVYLFLHFILQVV